MSPRRRVGISLPRTFGSCRSDFGEQAQRGLVALQHCSPGAQKRSAAGRSPLQDKLDDWVAAELINDEQADAPLAYELERPTVQSLAAPRSSQRSPVGGRAETMNRRFLDHRGIRLGG